MAAEPAALDFQPIRRSGVPAPNRAGAAMNLTMLLEIALIGPPMILLAIKGFMLIRAAINPDVQ